MPNSAWTLTDINESYEVCDTYPPLLAVPAAASTAVLVGCSRFRSKGRLPVLSYRHHNQVGLSAARRDGRTFSDGNLASRKVWREGEGVFQSSALSSSAFTLSIGR